MPWKPLARRTDANKRQSHRPSAAKRGYDRRWRDYDTKNGLADIHLRENPLCVECQKEGLIVPATEVDHIIPHRGKAELMWDAANLQGLCKRHHSRKTASGQ